MSQRYRNLLASTLFVTVATAALPSAALAQTALNVERATRNTFRVDGALRDWASVTMQSFGSGDDASFDVALAHDDQGVYVAARVRDERMIRTARPGSNEDVLVVTLATPGNEGLEAVEFWLYAGVEGESAAVALVGAPGERPRPARGARILEAAVAGGYELEAYLPFALIPNAARLSAARAAVRLIDVDVATSREIEATVASSVVDASNLRSLPEVRMTSGPANALASFRRDQGVGSAPPSHEFWGDVAGDAREERVLIIAGVVVIVGEGYRDGRGYDFERLGVRSDEDVQRARLEDVTGDGKAEIILRVRQRDRVGISCDFMILGTEGDGIGELFSAQVFERTRQGIVRGRVELRRQRRGPPFVDLHIGDAEGVDPARYAGSSGAQTSVPVLLPWGPVARQTWQWNGRAFAEVESQPNPNVRVPGSETPATPDPTATPEPRPEPPPARALSTDQVLARVRADRGIPASVAARFTVAANVAEGSEPEHVLALGNAVVVYGPGFQGGRGYFFFEAAETEADLLRVETAELTGDSRHEVIFVMRQNIGEFTREILTVIQFTDEGIQPLLRVEVARHHGSAAGIDNAWSIDRRARPNVLSIAPGSARTWDARTWPFSGFADDGVAPLLLPWQDRSTRRYRYHNGVLAAH